ncbi:MAG: glycosyltransferase family 2 protein [Myxococcales bacterium]|nr:glycosyltransferase family 2 protein [Myxococcales bacterium]
MIRVLLCAYNEEAVIGSTLRRVFEVLERSGQPARVLLVDDGSVDDTVGAARQVADARRGGVALEIVQHAENRGLGAALATGFAVCLREALDDDVIVTLDADDTHPPRLIPRLLADLERGNELVIASRYRPGATVSGVPNSRVALSFGIRFLLQLLFPIPGVRDYTCCFRAYRPAPLRRAQHVFGKELTDARGFEAVMDLLLRLRAVGIRAAEVPIELEYTSRVGRSKMNVLTTVKKTLRLVGRRFYESRTSDRADRIRERLSAH